MKTHVSKILSLAALAASAAVASATPPSINVLLAQAETVISGATRHNDAKALEPAKLSIDKALVLEPKNAWAWYYKGYAAYADFILSSAKNDAIGKENALNEADKDLLKSIDLQPTADALALHSSVLAGLIGVRGPESGRQLGPQIAAELGRAREMAPNGPRVLLTAGLAALYTPPEWGGDVNEAAKLLRQAVDAFAQAQPGAPEPSWGLAETHVWLGQTEEKLGHVAQAKDEYEKALAIDPNYAWVKDVLLAGLQSSAK